MPALPFVDHVLKAQLQWSDASGTTIYNTLFFRYSGGPPDASEALTLASDIYTAAEGLLGLANPDVQLTGCRVTDLSADDTGDALHTATNSGTNTGEVLPASTSLLINFSIGRRYRGGKPRNYFPFGSWSNLNGPRAWGTSFVTNAGTDWSTFAGAVLGATAGSTTITAHVNVSYYSGSTGSIVDGGTRGKTTPIRRITPAVDDIIGFAVAPRVATQRRRLGRS
jgi:hypothetical protein